MKKWLKTSLIAFSALTLVTQSTSVALAQDKEFEGEEVTVGVVGESSERVWDYLSEKALEEEGITIHVELLTDYVVPNVALADGSLDINAFQHVAFLENWNEENGEDLTPIGYTFVTKLGLYSDKYDNIEDLPDNAKIGIAADPTNGGRALLALEIVGLLEIDDEAGILPTVADITDNPKNFTFEELEAAQLPSALPDLDAAFINSGIASNAGLSTQDAIYADTDHFEKLSDAYRNVIATRPEDKDNPLYHKIVELYQQDDVAKVVYEADDGGSLPAWDGAPEFD